MNTLLFTQVTQKVLFLIAIFGFSFYASSQTQTETQVFTAQGTESNPAVITIDIPNDITVNNGQNIESIVIQEVKTEASIIMDLGGFPFPIPADCGDLISYSLALDGTITIPETCDADFQGQDVTSNTTVQLSTDLSLFTSLFPLTMDIEVTLAITYSVCSADAGEDTTIEPCKNEPIVLLDVLNGTPQTDGVWKDYNNNEVTDAIVTAPNFPGQYIYIYTVQTSQDCYDETVLFIDVQDCDYSSIKEESLNNISLYPNPTNGLLHIEGIAQDAYTLSIKDLNGRIVKEEKAYSANTSIDISGIQNGVYLVHILKNNSERVIRIVKQ